METDRKLLISGAGISGLTLAILLKEQGFEPLVVERDHALPDEGYMMDFFGAGFDVAERMDLADALRAIHYPIDHFEFVDPAGKVWLSVPVARLRRSLDDKYVYLRRSDLARLLYDRAAADGVAIRFGCEIADLRDEGDGVHASLTDGSEDAFALAFGADGVHSRVRALVFGDEQLFARFLGGYVAAFHLDRHPFELDSALKLYEEIDRVAGFYPLDERRMAATYVFRHDEMQVPRQQRLALMRTVYAGSGWIAEKMLETYRGTEPLYFDSLTQIAMPHWHKGRVALVGDACGCLTLIAGQGSQMAMAGAYVLARELERRGADYEAAFAAYEAKLKPEVEARQKDAATFERYFIPSARSRFWLRHIVTRLFFNRLLMPLVFRWFGAASVLKGYS
jgi:2-polyprenyl-6-methoxyphenol hydroxylase-like FAD-dependent oxidoreductase